MIHHLTTYHWPGKKDQLDSGKEILKFLVILLNKEQGYGIEWFIFPIQKTYNNA